MKRIIKNFGGALLLTIMFLAIESFATVDERCDDICTPKVNSTCSLPYGSGGDITICGGYEHMVTIDPIDP